MDLRTRAFPNLYVVAWRQGRTRSYIYQSGIQIKFRCGNHALGEDLPTMRSGFRCTDRVAARIRIRGQNLYVNVIEQHMYPIIQLAMHTHWNLAVCGGIGSTWNQKSADATAHDLDRDVQEGTGRRGVYSSHVWLKIILSHLIIFIYIFNIVSVPKQFLFLDIFLEIFLFV